MSSALYYNMSTNHAFEVARTFSVPILQIKEITRRYCKTMPMRLNKNLGIEMPRRFFCKGNFSSVSESSYRIPIQ